MHVHHSPIPFALQVCVARGTPQPGAVVPTPFSEPTSCTWPGISCSSTPPLATDAPQQFPCPRGVYIYQVGGVEECPPYNGCIV